jgi:hypothetical protein
MNSSTLKEKGFTEFLLLKELSMSKLPNNKGNVIAIIENTPSEKNASDILYIGRTKKLSKRIFGGYLAGYGGKTITKINTKLLNEGYLEKVAVGWIASDTPKVTQQELLDNFKKEHGRYPEWNASKKATEEKPTKKPASTPSKTKPTKRRTTRTVKKAIK